MSGKKFPRLGGIARDRLLQRLEAVVLLLVAQLLEEAHPQVLAVQILLLVEQMNLKQRMGHGVHRRAPPDARYAGTEIIHLDDEDAGERRRPPQPDIVSGAPATARGLRAG